MKYMPDQRLSTAPQHEWIRKLFGFDFSMEYMPGCLNIVADALSCRELEEPSLTALLGPMFALYDDDDDQLWHIRDTIMEACREPWRVVEGLILQGSSVNVPSGSRALPSVLQLAHTVGHEGV